MPGFFVILLAALLWGVGNALTGYTAHKYLSSQSLLPGVDIALANTLGGLLFLAIPYALGVLRSGVSRPAISGNQPEASSAQEKSRLLLAGALKGTNTCLFVFSTTYIVATQSLVLESTYIIWSLLLTLMLLHRRLGLFSVVGKTVLLFIGAFLVAGRTELHLDSAGHFIGASFGIGAGLSYALFLFLWGDVTACLGNLRQQIAATMRLLLISLVSIIIMAEVLVLIVRRSWWEPFADLRFHDILLQLVNGAFGVGATYLLITIGMTKLKEAREGAQFLAALGLSFSIPFTLLSEVLIGKFIPSTTQVIGLILFVVAFVILSAIPQVQKRVSGESQMKTSAHSS